MRPELAAVAVTDLDRARLMGAVLTGGESRRFGSDKALAVTHSSADRVPASSRLGAQAIEAMRGAGLDPIVAVGGRAGFELSVPVVADRSAGLGPLSGVASILVWAKRGYVLVLPCDLPLVTSHHLQPFLSWVDSARPGTAGLARVDGAVQPIAGIWPASAGPAITHAVRGGARRMFDALDILEWEPIDVEAEVALDADTPQDLSRLLGVDPNKP